MHLTYDGSAHWDFLPSQCRLTKRLMAHEYVLGRVTPMMMCPHYRENFVVTVLREYEPDLPVDLCDECLSNTGRLHPFRQPLH